MENQNPPKQPLDEPPPPQPNEANQQPAPTTEQASPTASKPAKNKKKLLIIIAAVVILLLTGAGGLLAAHKTKNNTTSNSASGSKSKETGKACTTESCFDPLFVSCTPASLNYTSPIASVKYKIFGPKSSGCSMSFEYTTVPNPAWVNQPMTCVFNNKEPLDRSVQDVTNNLLVKSNTYACTGPLVAILQSQ